MSLGLSKRQQARNERALQDLIKSVPGNNICADCQTKNPGWASWSLGVFLCMRCAGLHRKLGTHVSKVKSLSMDSWSSDQVDSMKRIGNIASNKVYNPKNIKPSIPIDADEVDPAMERFIRQKYEQRSLADGRPRPPSRDNTGGRLSDDSPPPLPPKTGKRFGFTLRAHTAPIKPAMLSPPPPVRVDVNNPSRVYTAAASDDTMDSKLATLREMGFPDDQRNSTVLKGLSGDLERTIESLVRLGEGSRPSSRVPTPQVTPRSGNFDHAEVNQTPPKPPAKSNNPFDMPIAGPRQQQSVGISFGHQSESPVHQQPQMPNFIPQQTNRSLSYNPFDISSQPPTQAAPLEQAFQSMQISQPLFPNSTGGYPSQQQQLQQARYQQSMTPPVPFLPQQYSYISTPPPMMTSSNPFFQSPPAQNTSTNPFFAQPQFPQSNPFSQLPSLNAQVQPQQQMQSQSQAQSPVLQLNTQMPQQSYHQQQTQPPVLQQNTQMPPQSQFQPQSQSPIMQQNSQMPQQPQFQIPQPQQSQPLPQPQHQYSTPQAYLQPPAPQVQPQQFFQPQQPQQQPQQPPQQLYAQQTGRIDKSSIMALYNYPQLAPSPLPTASSPDQNPPPQTMAHAPPQRSVTMPVTLPPTNPSSSALPPMPNFGGAGSGSRNPFLKAGTGRFDAIAEQPEIARHMSRESVQVHNLDSGRHSPDAFANLSARFVR